MSAATRRPYLGEDVHFHFLGECQAAKITRLGEKIELWVWFRRAPQYVQSTYSSGHEENTWHYAH